MQTKIQKWGNSLAIRIPKTVADEIGIEQNDLVEITIVAGKIVITPAHDQITLDQLLAGVTDENLHREIDSNNHWC